MDRGGIMENEGEKTTGVQYQNNDVCVCVLPSHARNRTNMNHHIGRKNCMLFKHKYNIQRCPLLQRITA